MTLCQFSAHVAPMRLDQLLDDGETDARTSVFARTGLLTAIEPFEDERKVFILQFPARIREDEQDLIRRPLYRNLERSPRRRVLEGVLKEVAHDLRELLRIGRQPDVALLRGPPSRRYSGRRTAAETHRASA